jgi:hypothetical protein
LAASSYAENKNPDRKHDHGDHAPSRLPKKGTSGAELTPDQRDLFNQIEELTESEGRTQHFARLWEQLICECSICVFKAIGETRMKKRQGEIRKSIGGTLHWNYKLFHEAHENRQRRKARECESAAADSV